MASIAAYKKYWKQIGKKEEALKEKRRTDALKVVRDLKDILVHEFDVKKVILFGSVLKKGCFDMDSDIDIAVKGLVKKSYFTAVARLMMKSPFDVDLKPVEDLKGRIRKSVEKGVILYEKRKGS